MFTVDKEANVNTDLYLLYSLFYLLDYYETKVPEIKKVFNLTLPDKYYTKWEEINIFYKHRSLKAVYSTNIKPLRLKLHLTRTSY